MTYDQVLQYFNLSQSQTEFLVSLGLIMLVVGFILVVFWQYIVAAAVVYIIVTISAHHVDPTPPAKDEVIIEDKSVFNDRQTYLDECKSLTDNSKVCENLVKESEPDSTFVTSDTKRDDGFKSASQVKLLDVDNQEYKIRRAKALKNPNAIIMQDILR